MAPKVWLNAGSRLLYMGLWSGRTRAQLTGRLIFDVVRNPEQPFTIHTRDMDIRVLGTAFNVRSYLMNNDLKPALFTAG